MHRLYKALILAIQFIIMAKQQKIAQEELPDDLNPQFLFCCIATDLLTKIVNGEIDPRELAWNELRNRGLDMNGKWIGFGEKEGIKPF